MNATRILVGAFVLGSLLIVTLRLAITGLNGAVFAAASAVAIIILVGLYYHKNYVLAEDRQMAGDNLYYLGLLFTLVSLILALLQLFVFDLGGAVDERADELIGNFGVALVSTVAGIFARILFQNPIDAPEEVSSNAPEEGESESRSELGGLVEVAEAVNLREELARLRLVLREANDAFMHFSRICSEQSENVVVHTDSMMQRQSESLASSAAHQLEQTSLSLKSVADNFHTEMRELSQSFSDSIVEFKNLTTAEANRGIEATSRVWGEASVKMQSDGESLIKALYGDINGLVASTEKTWSQMAKLSEMVAESVKGMRTNTESIEVMVRNAADAGMEMKNLVEGMKNARAELESAASAASNSAVTVTNSVSEFSKVQRSLSNDLNEIRLEAANDYKKVTNEISSLTGEQIESDSSKLKQSLKNAANDIDSHLKAGAETLDQAQKLSQQMTAEAEEWKKLSEHTRKSLVDAAEHLASTVRKV